METGRKKVEKINANRRTVLKWLIFAPVFALGKIFGPYIGYRPQELSSKSAFKNFKVVETNKNCGSTTAWEMKSLL